MYRKSTFQSLENTFHALEFIFQTLENEFHGLENTFDVQGKMFSCGVGVFFPSWLGKFYRDKAMYLVLQLHDTYQVILIGKRKRKETKREYLCWNLLVSLSAKK